MKRPPMFRQRGAAALEFGFVFPLLFLLVYGAIVYGFLFVVRESVEFAAHKAVEAAIAIDPGVANAQTERRAEACRASMSTLYWLSGSNASCSAGRVEVDYVDCSGSAAPCSDGYGKVTVTFRVLNGTSWFLPAIGLPGLGQIPPLPETLQATAVGRLDTP